MFLPLVFGTEQSEEGPLSLESAALEQFWPRLHQRAAAARAAQEPHHTANQSSVPGGCTSKLGIGRLPSVPLGALVRRVCRCRLYTRKLSDDALDDEAC